MTSLDTIPCPSQQMVYPSEENQSNEQQLDERLTISNNSPVDLELDPEFAAICSYIAQFGDIIDLELNIDKLKAGLEDQDHLHDYLIEVHVKLLKRIRRYFLRDHWEKALIKYTLEYSYDDAYEIESVGYLKSRPSVKLELLRRLLDSLFECDQKFKTAVNLLEADDLRIAPTGRDIHGNTYWHQQDNHGNFRIFQEQPLDYKSWKTICSNIDELNGLIEQLDNIKDDKVKGEPMHDPYNPLPEIFPELFKEKEKVEEIEGLQDESPKTKKGHRGKKGAKKVDNPLPALMEVDEENRSAYVTPPVQNGIKIEYESKYKPNGIHIRPKIYIKSENESIESQVETTINDLINMVVGRVDVAAPTVIKSEKSPTNNILTTMSMEEEEEEKPKPQRRKPAKKQRPSEEILPRRSSSRIQQLQMKRIAEQEEEMKKMIETNSKKANSITSSIDDDSRSRTSSKQNGKRAESREHRSKNDKKRRKRRSWKRGKGKKKLSWDKDDSDLSSTSSVTESEREDDFEEEVEGFKFEPTSYDNEFACEDEETSVEPVIIKRARTARQSIGTDGQGDHSTTSIIEEDKPCGRCDKSNDPEWILLCDMCDDGYHTSCCLPPLMIVPDGDWFCPSCEHKALLSRLRDLFATIRGILDARIVRSVPKPPIIHNDESESAASQVSEKPVVEAQDNVVSNSPAILSELDSETDVPDNATSDESFQASETEEEEEEEEEEDDEYLTETDTETNLSNQSEASFSGSTETSLDELVWDYAAEKRPKSKSKKKKRSKRYESDDSDFNPRATRKASRKQISYKESSEEDEADFINFE